MNDNYLTKADIDHFKQQLDTIINQQFKSNQLIDRWNLHFDRDLKKFVFAISSNQPRPKDWFGWPVEIIAKESERFLNLGILKIALDVLKISKEINKNLFWDKDLDTESEWAINIYLDNSLNLKIFNRAEFECGEYNYRDYNLEIMNPNTIKEQIQNLIDFDEKLREVDLLNFLYKNQPEAIKNKLNKIDTYDVALYWFFDWEFKIKSNHRVEIKSRFRSAESHPKASVELNLVNTTLKQLMTFFNDQNIEDCLTKLAKSLKLNNNIYNKF